MNHYRDPLAGLRSQITIKRAQAEEHERSLSPVLRALLPSPLRQALHELQPRAQADCESMEELAGAESALDAILALYDETRGLAEALRECEAQVPDPPSPGMPPPWLLEESSLLAVREAVNARLLRVHPDTQLSRWGDFGYIARFRIAAAPFVFVVSAEVMPDTEMVARHHSSLRTTVPEGLAALDVSIERVTHVIGKALHLTQEVEIGESAFDDRFWIRVSPITTAVLTPEVRASLEGLAHRSPSLHIGGGIASLAWSGHWRRAITDGVPEAALDVLAGIRAAIAHG